MRVCVYVPVSGACGHPTPASPRVSSPSGSERRSAAADVRRRVHGALAHVRRVPPRRGEGLLESRRAGPAEGEGIVVPVKRNGQTPQMRSHGCLTILRST